MTSAARAALVAILKGTGLMGRVHAYDRYSDAVEKLEEWFRDGSEVNATFVRSEPKDPVALAFGEQEQRTNFTIVWVRSVIDDEASRQSMEDDCETINNTLIAAHTLSGTVDNCTPPTRDDITRVKLQIGEGAVLCDRTVFRIQAQKRVAVTYA